jgi:hypothetical protein
MAHRANRFCAIEIEKQDRDDEQQDLQVADASEPDYRPHNAVIRVFDETGTVIETHEHAGDCNEW